MSEFSHTIAQTVYSSKVGERLATEPDLLDRFRNLDETRVDYYLQLSQFFLLRFLHFGQQPDNNLALGILRLLSDTENLPEDVFRKFCEDVEDRDFWAEDKIVTLDEIPVIMAQSQIARNPVSFMHGHYRFPTLGHYFSCRYVQNKYGFIVLGIESFQRTNELKTMNTPYTNKQRLVGLAAILPIDIIFLIDHPTGSEQEFYGQILQRIRPDFYISEALDKESLEDRRKRAELVGASLEIIPHFDFPSTTEELEKYLRVEGRLLI
jgi:hypothetical protein